MALQRPGSVAGAHTLVQKVLTEEASVHGSYYSQARWDGPLETEDLSLRVAITECDESFGQLLILAGFRLMFHTIDNLERGASSGRHAALPTLHRSAAISSTALVIACCWTHIEQGRVHWCTVVRNHEIKPSFQDTMSFSLILILFFVSCQHTDCVFFFWKVNKRPLLWKECVFWQIRCIY